MFWGNYITQRPWALKPEFAILAHMDAYPGYNFHTFDIWVKEWVLATVFTLHFYYIA